LTISKPEGGTVVADGGILCGAIGSICSADIPNGAPVTLHAQAADGYAFEQFTGDCPAAGDMTMTSAKTCGASFAKTAGGPAVTRPIPDPPVRVIPPKPKPPTPTNTVTPPPPVVATPDPKATLGPTPTNPDPTPTTPDKPAPPPISRDDH